MASRVKEDEKNERIIRGLLKLPSNRKCINCNTLGSQYVCTTFSTFVCTTCAGIHREFSHRIKSISMAKFTPQEVTSLQDGGNERAREIYFKEWDPQRQSAPDSNNVSRLRDFIKHVYVDRRYSGERSSDRPPQGKLGDKEEPNENKRSDGYHSGSRSPSIDDTYERRYSARSSPGYDVQKSPGYDQGNQRHSDYGRSPIRSGVVSDWRREDRFSNASKSEDRRSSDGESIRSPDNQKDSNVASLPVVRPVREILGDNVLPLKISEPPKANNTQRAESLSSLASSNGDPTEPRRETSLIDFDAEPEPSVAASTTIQAPQSTPTPLATQPTSAPSSDDNWACFDNVAETKVSEAPLSSNSLESVLTQLSVQAPTQDGSVNAASNGLFPSSTSGGLVYSGDASGARGLPPTLHANGASQWSSMQHEQQPFAHGVVSSQASHTALNHAPQIMEAKPSGRKELPADIFTAMYSSSPYQAPGWQARPVPGMGFPMYHPAMQQQQQQQQQHQHQHQQYQQYQQYPMYHPTMVAQPMPAYPQPSQPSNPFDVNVEASVAQAPGFPSMSSLHTALPNMSGPRGVVRTPNVGTPTPSWMPQQPQQSSFGSAMPGAYMGQQLPSNMVPPSRPQGFGGFVSDSGAFGSFNTTASAPNPSVSGNPFG